MGRPSFHRTAQRISARYKRHYYQTCRKLGELALKSVRDAVKAFGCSVAVAKYWKKKVSNPRFHSNTHGGARYDNNTTCN